MRDLSGKTVAITGAASGIGAALAAGLAAEGAHLALCDIDEERLGQTAELASASPKVTTHVADVSDRAAMEDFAEAVRLEHGKVDILINNAGMGCVASIEDTTIDDFTRVIGVNLWGAIHGVKVFLPMLQQREEATIVNMASLNALVPLPTWGAYNISKFGVDALTRTLGAELHGSQITVTAVYPGGVTTNLAKNALYVTDDYAKAFDKRTLSTPEAVAKRIIRGIRRKHRRIVIGPDARPLAVASHLAPRLTLRAMTWMWRRGMLS